MENPAFDTLLAAKVKGFHFLFHVATSFDLGLNHECFTAANGIIHATKRSLASYDRSHVWRRGTRRPSFETHVGCIRESGEVQTKFLFMYSSDRQHTPTHA
jgi:hypothetical protein